MPYLEGVCSETVFDRDKMVTGTVIVKPPETSYLLPRGCMGDASFKDRMFVGLIAAATAHRGKVSQEDIREDVARRLKRPGLTAAAVSRHFNGRIPRDLKTLLAYAQAMGVDPGWLAFGPDSKAPAPDVPAALLAQPVPRSKGKQKRA